jgi:hypothetical protein
MIDRKAIDRAHAILAELRTLLPTKMTKIDALARKLNEAGNRDRLQVKVMLTASLTKFEGASKPGIEPIDVINLREEQCR